MSETASERVSYSWNGSLLLFWFLQIGISPAKDACWAYVNRNWQKVGGPIDDLIAGWGRVYGISPGQTNNTYEFTLPDQWKKIGGPGRHWASVERGLYGISPSGTQVWYCPTSLLIILLLIPSCFSFSLTFHSICRCGSTTDMIGSMWERPKI